MIANETVNCAALGTASQMVLHMELTGREKIDADMSLFCRSHFHSGFLSI